MRGINRVLIVGHIGRRPEARTTPGGRVVVQLAVATNRSVKKGEEWVEYTEWHHIDVWEPQADIALRYLDKGVVVCVEGRLQTDSWEDKDSGKKVYKTKVVCERLHLVDRSRQGDPVRPVVGDHEAPAIRMAVADDRRAEEDIPF